MRVSQNAIDQGMMAGRKALQNYSAFDSAMVPDSALRIFVTEVLTAGFGTIPNQSIMGPGAHKHALANPSTEAAEVAKSEGPFPRPSDERVEELEASKSITDPTHTNQAPQALTSDASTDAVNNDGENDAEEGDNDEEDKDES